MRFDREATTPWTHVTAELLLAALRLAHALAAAVWLGGTLTYALTSAVSTGGSAGPMVWRGFREALRTGIGVFVLTGVVMAAERLSAAALPPTYAALLAIKVLLGLWMFSAARQIGGETASAGSLPMWRRAEAQVLGVGVVIYAIAIALRSIYEQTIRGS
ncbi:MAG: hypothetical protein HW416_1677 [Chloroflexi bacterium]|nr:hypothetical protein [Chloroflexota bacterium]